MSRAERPVWPALPATSPNPSCAAQTNRASVPRRSGRGAIRKAPPLRAPKPSMIDSIFSFQRAHRLHHLPPSSPLQNAQIYKNWKNKSAKNSLLSSPLRAARALQAQALERAAPVRDGHRRLPLVRRRGSRGRRTAPAGTGSGDLPAAAAGRGGWRWGWRCADLPAPCVQPQAEVPRPPLLKVGLSSPSAFCSFAWNARSVRCLDLGCCLLAWGL